MKTSHYENKDQKTYFEVEQSIPSVKQKTIIESGFLRIDHIFYDPRNEHSLINIRSFFNEYFQKYISKDSKVLLLLKEGRDLVFKH